MVTDTPETPGLKVESAEGHESAFHDEKPAEREKLALAAMGENPDEDNLPPLSDDESEDDEPREIPEEDDRVLTLSDVLNVEDEEQITVYVPQWHGKVQVRSLTQVETSNIYKKSLNKKGKNKGNIDISRMSMLMFITGCVEPSFTVAHYDALGKKNAGAVATVVGVISRISGMEDLDEAIEAAKQDLG